MTECFSKDHRVAELLRKCPLSAIVTFSVMLIVITSGDNLPPSGKGKLSMGTLEKPKKGFMVHAPRLPGEQTAPKSFWPPESDDSARSFSV